MSAELYDKDWFPFKLCSELVVRMAAGEMSALFEFVESNIKFLTGWAVKVLRNYTNVVPANEYEAGDCINQIFVDFIYYDFSDVFHLLCSIFRSFVGVASGGISKSIWCKLRNQQPISLDTPLNISQRSGDKKESCTLGEMLASDEPSPLEVIETDEHIKEIAPRYFNELGRIFGVDTSGATIGELLAFKGKEFSGFRDVVEEVFRGYTFEEVRTYARQRTA